MENKIAADFFETSDRIYNENSVIGEIMEKGFPWSEFVFIVNDAGCLVGRINYKQILEVTSPNLFFLSQNNRKALWERIRNIKIKDIMDRKVVSVSSDTSFTNLLDTLVSSDIDVLPVVDKDGFLLGEISAGIVLDKMSLSFVSELEMKKPVCASAS